MPDASKVGYRQTGHGPGLILLHGGLQSSANFTRLAKALSNDFTVSIPDRRGRGLSDPYRAGDGLEAETGDLALVRYVRAERVFALSSGAIITLQAALKEPALTKIALYEPPIPLDENQFEKLDRDYDRAMRKGNLGRAFITIMKEIDDPSFSLLKALPSLITGALVNLMMRTQAKADKDHEVTLKELIPTFYHDRIIVRDAAHLLAEVGRVQADTLLMQGGKSQPFLGETIRQLLGAIPNVALVKFPRQGHMAADNTGDPTSVANELLKFFKDHL